MKKSINLQEIFLRLEQIEQILESESADIDERTGEPRQARHFMAFVVWNYGAEPKPKLQILEITQKGIKDKLTNLNKNKVWGNPIGDNGYDIVITRTKTGASQWDVEYDTIPNPKEKLSKEILDVYKASNIKLEALFDGIDPFGESITETEMDEILKEVE